MSQQFFKSKTHFYNITMILPCSYFQTNYRVRGLHPLKITARGTAPPPLHRCSFKLIPNFPLSLNIYEFFLALSPRTPCRYVPPLFETLFLEYKVIFHP